jgi:hypothetical protein
VNFEQDIDLTATIHPAVAALSGLESVLPDRRAQKEDGLNRAAETISIMLFSSLALF